MATNSRIYGWFNKKDSNFIFNDRNKFSMLSNILTLVYLQDKKDE